MKQSLLAIALATIALSSTAQAAYVYKLPLEVAGGGSLPNGTITFGNGGATTPTVPTEPEVIDPFEKEFPDCDNYATTYPEIDYGRDSNYYTYIYEEPINGVSGPRYSSCKLKDTGNPELIARFVDGVSYINYTVGTQAVGLSMDRCDQRYFSPYGYNSGCAVKSSRFTYLFKYSKDAQGVVTILGPNKVDFNKNIVSVPVSDIGRLVIDGQECTDLRVKTELNGMYVASDTYSCSLNIQYDILKSKMGKPYIVEIYRK